MIYVIWYMVKHEEPTGSNNFATDNCKSKINRSCFYFDVQLFVFYFLAQAKEFLK